jgi:hypothetical protein
MSPGEEGKICLLRRWPLHAQRARQFALATLLCFLFFSDISTISPGFDGLTVFSTVNSRGDESACSGSTVCKYKEDISPENSISEAPKK